MSGHGSAFSQQSLLRKELDLDSTSSHSWSCGSLRIHRWTVSCLSFKHLLSDNLWTDLSQMILRDLTCHSDHPSIIISVSLSIQKFPTGCSSRSKTRSPSQSQRQIYEFLVLTIIAKKASFPTNRCPIGKKYQSRRSPFINNGCIVP